MVNTLSKIGRRLVEGSVRRHRRTLDVYEDSATVERTLPTSGLVPVR